VKLARGCAIAAAGVTALSLAFVVVWAFANLRVRPLMGGEGEVLFEAARMRAGLPLYIDPIAGALDYGEPAARYYVLYPPVWSWVLSWIPVGAGANGFAASVAARVLGLGAWAAALAVLVARADRGSRLAALAFALFFASIFNLELFIVTARPDAAAALLAAVALERATRHGKVDAIAGALFALAAWTKPTFLGLAAGAFGVTLLLAPRLLWRALAGALAVSAVLFALLQHASDGHWFRHLLASTLQPFDRGHWTDSISHEAFFFFAPAAYALARAWKRRDDPRLAVGLGALAVALVWGVVSVAKVGSATNYWIETALGVVAIAARLPPTAIASSPVLAALALVQALWSGVASMRSAPEWIASDRRVDALLANARTTCGARDTDFVLSDEVGTELRLDGRLATTAYQMAFLAEAGRFPVAPWIEDIDRANVTCFVEHFHVMRRVPELTRALDAKFEPAASTDGWTVLRVRPAGSVRGL
jgi:hypothetical protein